MFVASKQPYVLMLFAIMLLASCSHSTPPADTPQQVLGIGSINIGSIDIAAPSLEAANGVQTASFESGYVNFPSELVFTTRPVTQLTFGSANGIAGRYLLTRVRLRNTSGRALNNLTLLGVSLAGADQSLTPFSRVQTIVGSSVNDANSLYQIKPSHPISVDGITNASFVAFSESDLDADLRATVGSIPGVNVAAVLPYGFWAGDVSAGQEVAVDIGFFIPDGNPVGRFSFRFAAVTDSIERVTQGINEIDIEGSQDRGYAAVRERFGTPANDKTLVLTGPFVREVAPADATQNIFTLLPDIRIAGTAQNPLATLFDSGSTVAAQINTGQDTNADPDVTTILSAHNQYRTEVGVPLLTWSATLASDAQAWANVLAAENALRHEEGLGVGENLAAGSIGFFSPVSFVNLWGAEKADFIPGGIFPNVSVTGDWTDVGHYTQMVWSTTTEVGCAIADGDALSFFVCRYSPPGNFTGETPY